MNLTLEERFQLIKSVAEEIVQEDELKELLSSGKELISYDGIEPSGQLHIAQGLIRTINTNKLIKAGVKFKMWIADWHALANNKMGGDLQKIQTVGKYFIEIWKASGMNLSGVEFVWASDLLKDQKYWMLVLKIAKSNSLKRFIRTAEIMGREESMELTAAQILYPCMQAADIFNLNVNITQLGMDQRKVNMLAREIALQLGFQKPIILSNHMLMGLGKPATDTEDKVKRTIELKMSKSKPDSAIFMTDSIDEVIRKINKAYCLEGDIKENPILEYCRYIIFEAFDLLKINSFLVERPEKYGGNLEFKDYATLEITFQNKKLHPSDLKTAVARDINKLLEPVRKHFMENKEAKELLEKVKSYQITR